MEAEDTEGQRRRRAPAKGHRANPSPLPSSDSYGRIMAKALLRKSFHLKREDPESPPEKYSDFVTQMPRIVSLEIRQMTFCWQIFSKTNERTNPTNSSMQPCLNVCWILKPRDYYNVNI